MQMTRPPLLASIALVWTVAAAMPAAQAPAPKAPPPDVGSGRVVWFDITTRDLPRAKAFYGDLFGWTFASIPGAADLAVEIVSGDLPIRTIRVAEGPITAFDGVVYLQVADLPASCTKVTALGGTVAPGFPFNLTGRPGAIALFTDPSGHPVGMYSRTPLPR